MAGPKPFDYRSVRRLGHSISVMIWLQLYISPLYILMSGCVGPAALQSSRLRYNEAYRKTNDEEILLNIVRLRYADSPVFMDLPNITSQFQVSATGMGAGGIDGQGPGPTRLGIGELFLKDAPTLSYSPRSGQQVGKRLMTPLTAELLRSISPGGDTGLFLLAAVNSINDVRNAPLATSMNPEIPDSNDVFRNAVRLFVNLQNRGAIELRVATFDDDSHESVPRDKLIGRDLLEAAKDGKTFRSDGNDAVLIQRKKSLVIVVRPEEVGSPDVIELIQLFGLESGRTIYRIVSRENDEIDQDELPSPLGEDTIRISLRSLLHLMVFLSKGVEIPAAHDRRGIAPATCGPDGNVYDWTSVTRGFFHIRSQKLWPKHADSKVYYRGHWYYIEENDTQTRGILSLLELILELQESESERAGPLLTLPVG